MSATEFAQRVLENFKKSLSFKVAFLLPKYSGLDVIIAVLAVMLAAKGSPIWAITLWLAWTFVSSFLLECLELSKKEG